MYQLAARMSSAVNSNLDFQSALDKVFQDSRLKIILFLPETSVTVKWEDSSKTKNVASEEPPQKKIKKPLSKRDPKVKVITEHSYIYIHIYGN